MSYNECQCLKQKPQYYKEDHIVTLSTLSSPLKTREAYNNSLKRYLNHLKTVNPDDLLLDPNPRAIETQIIDYIMTLRNDGLAYNTTQFLVAPIFTFYSLNDVVLNRKKDNRYYG